MEFKFIDNKGLYYQQAVDLRISLFFKGMKNAKTLINDAHEVKSIQLVCLNEENKVIGTGRLFLENDYGIISQMAIEEKYQRNGIGKKIMKILIDKCKECNVLKLKLSAREKAVEFYESFNFKQIGEKYPSNKTGIIHQMMSKKLR